MPAPRGKIISEIVLVPGPLNQFVFTEPEVKLAPREKSRSGKSPIEEPAPRRGRRAPKPEPPPVIAGPDTGWPPPQVMTTIVINRDAFSNGSRGELFSVFDALGCLCSLRARRRLMG